MLFSASANSDPENTVGSSGLNECTLDYLLDVYVNLCCSYNLFTEPFIRILYFIIEYFFVTDYLCLYIYSMQTSGSHDPRCIFRELFTVDGFSEFQSVYNTDWFVMFGKHGERLHGFRWSSPPGGSSSDRQQSSNHNQTTLRHRIRHNGQSRRRKTLPDLCRRFVKIQSSSPASSITAAVRTRPCAKPSSRQTCTPARTPSPSPR